MDSCHSGSGTRDLPFEIDDPSEIVRSVKVHNGFQLEGSLDQEIWSKNRTCRGLRSHVLLSACGSSGQAWESNGRGDFTVALLNLLEKSKIDDLRYRDIIMRININSRYVYKLSVRILT